MPKTKPLTLSTAGAYSYIEVPSLRGPALCTYLRDHGVDVSPPAPSCTGFDSLTLGKGTKVKTVQDLLKNWA